MKPPSKTDCGMICGFADRERQPAKASSFRLSSKFGLFPAEQGPVPFTPLSALVQLLPLSGRLLFRTCDKASGCQGKQGLAAYRVSEMPGHALPETHLVGGRQRGTGSRGRGLREKGLLSLCQWRIGMGRKGDVGSKDVLWAERTWHGGTARGPGIRCLVNPHDARRLGLGSN